VLAPAAPGNRAPDRLSGPLLERVAAQLAKRLRGQDPRTMPALGWLEDRLAQQGLTVDEAVEHAQQRQGASNVTVRNIITSMRLISAIDWAELFEAVSLVDARLRGSSQFADTDFQTRNLYRSAIEQLARFSPSSELDIAGRAVDAAAAVSSDALRAAAWRCRRWPMEDGRQSAAVAARAEPARHLGPGLDAAAAGQRAGDVVRARKHGASGLPAVGLRIALVAVRLRAARPVQGAGRRCAARPVADRARAGPSGRARPRRPCPQPADPGAKPGRAAAGRRRRDPIPVP